MPVLLNVLHSIKEGNSLAVGAVEWTQLLAVVVVGLLIALALQCLVVVVGGAIAVSLCSLPRFSGAKHSSPPTTPFPIGTLVGLGTLMTVNGVLFAASFLTITLMQVPHPFLGAIAGIVLWAAYFLLVVWLSLRTITAWGGTLLSLSTAGLRQLFTFLIKPFETQRDNLPLTQSQLEIVIHEELQTALSTLQTQLQPESSLITNCSTLANEKAIAEDSPVSPVSEAMQESLQRVWQQILRYLQATEVKNLAPKSLKRTLEEMLKELPEGAGAACAIATTQDLLSVLAARDDVSAKKKARIMAQIQSTWASHLSASDLASDSQPSQPNACTTDAQAGVTGLSALPLETAIAPLQAALNSPTLKPQLEQLLTGSPAYLSDVSQTVEQQAEHLRDRATTQLADLQKTIQQNTQTRLDAIRQDAQTRLTSTRKTLAVALWWMVATLCTGGISAAVAGAIAAGW